MVKINFSSAKFYKSYGTSGQFEDSTKPEIAFVGRSNVGKSSILNKLTGNSKLAKVSSSPGKTTTINFFDVGNVYLVDLPGYGFAARSNKELQRWQDLMVGYFEGDRNFLNIVCLIDIRHMPSLHDMDMVNYIFELGLPFTILLTKADKLSKQKCNNQKRDIIDELGLDERVNVIMSSAEKNTGIAELKKSLEICL